jgi:TolB-like protein/Flp pilus assembly protein TadD
LDVAHAFQVTRIKVECCGNERFVKARKSEPEELLRRAEAASCLQSRNSMTAESSSDLRFEIGHVLFIDIVGYSKLLINEQSEQLQELKEIVRGTEQFRLAEAEGKLLRLPTGDGGALVFRNSSEAPVMCALEISKALKSHPEVQVRMGIHSGPVNEVADLNEQLNVAGAGINIAQRIMDCGDAGHILLSKHVAEDLEHYGRWRPHLHDLGECEVKHGVLLSVVNLYTDEVGNAQTPEKLKAKGQTETRTISMLGFDAHPIKRVIIAAVATAILAIALFLFLHRSGPSEAKVASNGPSVSTNDKSIAVLPFANLSRDPDNAYFAAGIQDEIITRLSKIAELKVISCTSTQRFKSSPEDLPSIAKQLGVSNILEGSVQKAADQVRVNVQLIKAATDDHLWADTFDRKLTDIFRIESEIAKTISDTLQAKLTGAEKQMISSQPTSDLTAYDLYLKGRSLWGKRGGDNLRQAIGFYEQAIARDPNYALAYTGLADAYIILPAYTATAPRDVLPKAKAAALKALQLDDKLAEAHTALAFLLCIGDLDMARSISEFQRAIALNPNYATAHQWYGNGPLTALGRFDEAIAEGKRAIELDPLSPIINSDLGQNLFNARRYDEAIAQLRKTLEIDSTLYIAHFNLGFALQLKGDVPAAIAEYTKAQELSDNPRIPLLIAAAKAESGDKDAAMRMLAELEELSRHWNVPAYWCALLYLSLGNRDEAIRWLEQGIADPGSPNIVWIKVDPMLDPLRGDPRFDALVQKIVRPK